MTARFLVALLGALLAATSGLAGQTAGCWYPLDQDITCSAASATDANGMLKPGIHAVFSAPTHRYGHNILGDTPEWGQLDMIWQGSPDHGPYWIASLKLPQNRIFEDIAPRLADVTGDGSPEVIVVETHINKGARLAIYAPQSDNNGLKLLAATPYIGTTHRWLAPVGIADFNSDGAMDLAYVDRPHLAITLRVWTYRNGKLHEIARLKGVTNHQIGQTYITSGVRDCGQGPEMLLQDSNWQNVLAIRLRNGALHAKKIGPFKSAKSTRTALTCPD